MPRTILRLLRNSGFQLKMVERLFTTWYLWESQVSGYFLILIISAVLHRSATFQPSIGSQSMASKNGLVSEVSSRWQFAGFFQVSWCRLTHRASIAVHLFTSKCGMELYQKPTRRELWGMLPFLSQNGRSDFHMHEAP